MTTAARVVTGRPLASGATRWRNDSVFYTGIACLVYDKVAHGRVHRAFALGALFIILSQPLRILIGFSGPWQAFAAWLTR